MSWSTGMYVATNVLSEPCNSVNVNIISSSSIIEKGGV